MKEAVLEYIYQKAFHISHHSLDWKLTWLNLNQLNFQNTSTTQKRKPVVKIKLTACKIVDNNNNNRMMYKINTSIIYINKGVNKIAGWWIK